jgi:hypothetical protein
MYNVYIIKYISSPFGLFFSGEIDTAVRRFDELHFSIVL